VPKPNSFVELHKTFVPFTAALQPWPAHQELLDERLLRQPKELIEIEFCAAGRTPAAAWQCRRELHDASKPR